MADGIIRLDEGWRLDEGHHFDEPPHVSPPPATPPPRLKEKGKHMDYIPNKRLNRYDWYRNLSDNILIEAPKFGLSSGDATAAKALADAILAKMDETSVAEAALDGARQAERDVEEVKLAQIRAAVANWKTLPGMPGSGSDGVLKLQGTVVVFDPTTYKPVLQVFIEADKVRVAFQKKGVEAMAIYARLRGTPSWERLAIEHHAPYFDTRPLAQSNVPEVREYMARGVVNDEEIGVDSDIVSITFAG
ncbi:MAG: hypothetical protein NT105_18125 [Verrucomicrobia bacterium]|nr:hypothetical protein [Verrucomicrobiota bacterium]